jgi:tetratricopeptide (TPR) repeat protein
MGVARPSHFEERLRAILDPSLHRRGPSAGQARVAAAVLFTLAATIAAVEPWAPRSAEAAMTSEPADADPFGVGLGSTKAGECAEKARSAKEKEEVKPLLLADGFTMDPSESGESGAPGGVWSAASEGAETEADEAEETEPTKSDSQDGMQHAVESGAPESAKATAPGLVKASNGESEDGDDWYGRGMKLHRRGRYEEAIEAFRNAYQADYRRDASAYNIACGYALKGDSDRAFEWLEKAAEEGFDVSSYLDHDEDLESLQSDSRTPKLRKKLRELQVASRGREAERLAERFQRLAQENPQDGDGWYELGKKLLKVGRYGLAGKAFQLSAKAGNRVGASLYNTACALSLEGDRAAALDFLEKSLLAGFDDPSLVRKDGDLDAIREEPRYRELVELAEGLELRSAEEVGGKKRHGGEEAKRASWARAARRYESFANQHPKIGRAWFNLGFASLAGGDAAGGARAFERAVSLGYREPTTMYNLACSYSRLDRKDEAFGWLFKALDAGFEEEWTLRHDDDLEALRGDSRYRKALKIVRGNSRHGD